MTLEAMDAAGVTTVLGETTLAEGIERYASMFTHHPHAAYSVDRCGYYTDANPRALEMTGLSLEQMRETHFSEVIHPDDVHLFHEAFARAMDGAPQLIEARAQRTDGGVVDIRCTAIPVVVSGEVVGVHGITEDVTDAKRVLRELEEANAAKTLFLATVSHEVRTPLAVLLGATDLLVDTDLPPEAAHCAELVHRSSARLMDLVDDILEFSGLDAHQCVLRPGPVDVRSLVRVLADWAREAAETRGLTLSFVVEDSVPATAVGDGRRIAQVVTNLVQNAITFTERGAVDVRVHARSCEAGSWVEFTVSDTGIGIAPDQVQALFEPFVQAEPHLTHHHRGVGLGLAICRELVDLMEGHLGVCSTPGKGSTFTFGVPMGIADDGPAASASS